MTAETIKDAIFLSVMAFAMWRVMRLELNLSKMQMDLEHQIYLLRVYKEDKK